MVVKMSSPGRSFGGVADYCLHDPRMPGEAHHPESAERVEWTETRNLATSEGERAGRIMAATAEASPDLKHLAGGAATGRKLEKPVCHYSLSWAKDEKPDRQEMRRAAQESLKALGMERHQALVVSHRDGQPHVHVIANRVDPESGKAAGLSRSKLRLSQWVGKYEREQGEIRCPQREPREAIPAGRDGWGGPERERVAWQRAEERGDWEQLQRRRGKALGELEKRARGSGRVAWQRAEERGDWEQLQRRRGKALGELEKRSSGRRFTGVTSGSGSSWRKTAVGCWGASGLGGSWAAECERSAGRSGETRKCWDASGRSWRTGYAGSGFRWEKRIPKRREGSRARRENSTARTWKGRRNGRGRRRGRTGSYCVMVVVLSIGTGSTSSSTRCRRSGWSRCGRSTESWLTRR